MLSTQSQFNWDSSELHSGAHPPRSQRGWTKHAIAELDSLQIAHLPVADLMEIVEQVCAYLPQPAIRTRLRYYDREVLERLTYLARQCCRKQGY